MALAVLRSKMLSESAVQSICILLPYSRRRTGVKKYTYVPTARYVRITDVKTVEYPSKHTAFKLCQASFSCEVGPKQCWKCRSEVADDTEFCLSCKSLQPLDHHRNHFSILKIKQSFNLDTKALTRKFRLLQTQFHPDRYSVKPEREQQFAHDHSSAVNKAYRCVLHPVERALYLLHLAGQPLEEGQIDLDPQFLMAIMEVNEELAEAKDRETVQAIGVRNTEILDNLLSEADAAFSSNEIDKARTVVAKIKYYNNIYEKVKSFEREHGIVD